MKFIPTLFDRTLLLLVILYSMAICVPNAWIAMYGWSSSPYANTFLAIFVASTLLTVTIAGTKRQFFIAFAAVLGVAIAWGMSMLFDLTGLADKVVYRPNGRVVEFYEGTIESALGRLAICSAIMYALSFALSFVFDRLIGPVSSREQKVEEKPIDSGDVKKSSSQFRALAILAASLFIVQVSINAADSSSANQLFGVRIELLAAALFSVIGFGLACRFSAWKSAVTILIFTVAIVFAAVRWLSIEMKTDIDSTMFVILWVGVFATFMTVWGLAGSKKEKATWRPGLLGILSIGVLCCSGWLINNYDIGSLLFSPHRFDFEIAKSIKRLNSHPSVSVRMQAEFAGRSRFEISFDNQDGIEDFFTENPLPDIPMMLSISHMPENVELSGLENLTLTDFQIFDGKVSSKQFVSLAKIQKNLGLRYISFNNCGFVPGPGKWPPSTRPKFFLNSMPSGECVIFFEAIKGLKELDIMIGGFSGSAVDALAFSDALKDRPGKMSLGSWSRIRGLAAGLDSSIDLSNVSLGFVDFVWDQEPEESVQSYLDLILNSSIRMNIRLPSEEVFWNLLMGAKGQIEFYQPVNVETVEGTAKPDISNLDEQTLRDRHLVYDGSRDGEPITKLFLPTIGLANTKQLSSHSQLRSLSFDGSWLDASYHFDSSEIDDFSFINDLDELRELYLHKWISENDFSVLSPRKSIETLQFHADSTGFAGATFPNLKHAILVLDGLPGNNLFKELRTIKSLEKVSLVFEPIRGGGINPAKPVLAQVKGLLPNVQVDKVKHDSDAAPDDFKQHRESIRKQCIEKYLK